MFCIFADAPDFVEMSTDQEIVVTGIKVVNLLAPYAKGGKIGKQPRKTKGGERERQRERERERER